MSVTRESAEEGVRDRSREEGQGRRRLDSGLLVEGSDGLVTSGRRGGAVIPRHELARRRGHGYNDERQNGGRSKGERAVRQ